MPCKNRHEKNVPKHKKCSGTFSFIVREILIYLAPSHQAIDLHPDVETWVRNVDRQAGSFWLPTSSDKFYPDFVAMLTDGRILLVEYKGKHLLSNDDTKEKRNIGELWAEKSNGRGLFLLVSESVPELGFERQMSALLKKS